MQSDINKDQVLVISNEIMGHGDVELGAILIRSFVHTLSEAKLLPGTIIFYNTGAKLVVKGSTVLEDLKLIQNKGVKILACGTCLGHFNLKEQIAIGKISNMYDISDT
ncbi:MAG TPA: sulfurtransferase-like selenium metabolism protein YedF, partial [Caldithrix sp.]|nr:sulfurtransferase-like selenium metabolism protein YedF [Caldithrix sp.]